MDDPVVSLERVSRDVANVHANRGELERVVEEVASLVEERVEAGHVVTGLLQHRRHNGADVAVVSGNKDLMRGARPRSYDIDRKPCGCSLSDGAYPTSTPNDRMARSLLTTFSTRSS